VVMNVLFYDESRSFADLCPYSLSLN
jgi:hypothetical protein